MSRLTIKQRIYNLLLKADQPLTDEEIRKKLKLNPNTARPRRIELERAGLVVAAAEVMVNGRYVYAWTATSRINDGEFV